MSAIVGMMAAVKDDDRVVAALLELRDVVRFIDKNTGGMAIPGDHRSRLVLGCFDLAIEHQAGILILVEHGLIGPAYALLRCLVDATVRGMWLLYCASVDDLQTFQRDGLHYKGFKALATELEAATATTGSALTTLHECLWSIMSDYTHTGFQHVVRRSGDGFTGPNYPVEEVTGNLRIAASIGLVAATFLAHVAMELDVAQALLERSRKLNPNAPP